jgi:CHAT domain-containing protein
VDQNENELNQRARELSQLILDPVANELNKKRLIIVADGALNYIPFQLLATSAGAEPLVANHYIISAPSATVLGQLQMETAQRKAPAKVLAAFGDPVFARHGSQQKDAKPGEELVLTKQSGNELWQDASRDIDPDNFDPSKVRPLVFTKFELANLREVAGSESLVATGYDASCEKLVAADLTQFAILHIATHGIFDPQRPERSGLLLSLYNREDQAQKGFLGLQDIYNLRAPVALVVLSACSTGLGKDVRGEGLIGVTRGFMYAGASSVVASLWKVDDESTGELMKQFYANMLQQRMTPAEALATAQNRIRSNPEWRSPHHWAAFTIQGDYRSPITTSGAKSTPAHLVWIFLVGLLAIVAWRFQVYRRTQNSNSH